MGRLGRTAVSSVCLIRTDDRGVPQVTRLHNVSNPVIPSPTSMTPGLVLNGCVLSSARVDASRRNAPRTIRGREFAQPSPGAYPCGVAARDAPTRARGLLPTCTAEACRVAKGQELRPHLLTGLPPRPPAPDGGPHHLSTARTIAKVAMVVRRG